MIRARGVARERDFKAAGISFVYLTGLLVAVELAQLGRGPYQGPSHTWESAAHDLAEAARFAKERQGNARLSCVAILRATRSLTISSSSL